MPDAPDGRTLVERTRFSLEGGHSAATKLLDRGATGHRLRLATRSRSGRSGRCAAPAEAFPADVSVVGYDDSVLMAARIRR